MHKRNREIVYIEDDIKRRNAKCKRTRQILKKAHELAVLCNLNINISLYDAILDKLVVYAADK